jgi:hypothetical protein
MTTVPTPDWPVAESWYRRSGVWNNLRSMVTGWYDLGNPRMTDVR